MQEQNYAGMQTDILIYWLVFFVTLVCYLLLCIFKSLQILYAHVINITYQYAVFSQRTKCSISTLNPGNSALV